MHIEPGVVNGAKIVLSYATAAGAFAYAGKMVAKSLLEKGLLSLIARSSLATLAVLIFFEILPKFPVGVSEVHFILGSTILLVLGTAPAAIGLTLGLLVQGLFMSPADLPQYFMNATTLLVPLFGIHYLAKRIISPDTAYVDLDYTQALKLSAAYQGGVVAWVAFWAFYGSGFGAENITAVMSFGAAYMMVLLIEPIADLAVLAGAKSIKGLRGSGLVTPRLYNAA